LHLWKNNAKANRCSYWRPGIRKDHIDRSAAAQRILLYPEISREVTLEAKKNGIEQLFLEKPLLFSELLLEGRKKQYRNALEESCPVVFIDRGIPDVLAYMHYIGDSYPAFFDEACREHRYHKIFLLPPWEDIYESDNERYENFEQAKLIHEHLVETYTHHGYELIPVPKDTVKNRLDFILTHLGIGSENHVRF